MRQSQDFKNLTVQMITRFILVVLLTATAVGTPAIWMLQNQLENQSWAQIDQAQHTMSSLYANRLLELQNLAIITAGRPTLQRLLSEGNQTQLMDYLDKLQRGAGVDLIGFCHNGDILPGTIINPGFCSGESQDGYLVIDQISTLEIWMISRSTILINNIRAEVIIGKLVDDDFAREIKDQTTFEHWLCYQESLIAASLSGRDNPSLLPAYCSINLDFQNSHHPINLNGVLYYASAASVSGGDVKLITAMDISEILAGRKQLALWMAAAILGVAVGGSTLGVLFSRQLSRPLVKLSEAATTFSSGDLETPVIATTRIREIAQVALTLDQARIDLHKTLTSLAGERDWSENLLASIVEGIITLDSGNRITFFSHGAERITGWLSGEVLGKPIDHVFLLIESDQLFSSLLPAILKGRQKADVRLAGDRVASIAVTSAKLPYSTASDTEIALVFRDISEEEAVHRLLGHFIADVAHELRTPLTALEASIELLLDQTLVHSEQDLKELYTSLHLGILGLHTLVDNLLESANIEARRFRISPRTVDLSLIVAEAIQTMQPLLNKYEQRLTAELPVKLPLVKADFRRTVQVLVNLISNANRYGPPGEEIKIKVTTSPGFARLEVCDRGPGILPEHRANLFLRFDFPHTDNSASQAGAGLGLSVVKEIVLAHGGEVGVEDRPGSGSIFWFTLPIIEEKT